MATEEAIETLKKEMEKQCPKNMKIGDLTSQRVHESARHILLTIPYQTARNGQKFNDLVKTLEKHTYDTFFKNRWNHDPVKRNLHYYVHRYVASGLLTHESKINELVERMETLEKTNKILETKVEKLEVENKHLKNCIIDKSKFALVIQRYWKKYLLIKRIKEASKIFKFTRNFSHFVNPVEIMEDLIDLRSTCSESTPCSPTTIGRKHRGPPSVASEMSIRRSEQVVRDWLN